MRRIASAAGEQDYRLSAFVKEVVRSEPFRMSMAAATVEEPGARGLEPADRLERTDGAEPADANETVDTAAPTGECGDR